MSRAGLPLPCLYCGEQSTGLIVPKDENRASRLLSSQTGPARIAQSPGPDSEIFHVEMCDLLPQTRALSLISPGAGPSSAGGASRSPTPGFGARARGGGAPAGPARGWLP